MEKKHIPYKYDVSASAVTIGIILLGNFLDRGNVFICKLFGILILFCAVIIWIIPLYQLKKFGGVEKNKKYFETNKIVTEGIYSVIRHPQYFSYMLLNIGFSLIHQNILLYILAFLAVMLFYKHTLEEEKELLCKFPNEYRDYCNKTARFNFIKNLLN